MDTKKITSQLNSLEGCIAMFADGFIDEQWALVNSRASMDEVSFIGKMTQFADRINAVGSGGMGIELIKKRVVFGGFTANIGHAAAALGVSTVMAGLFGEGEVDPVFAELQGISRMITLGAPSITHALEFDDGKILMTNMEAVLGMRWSRILEALGMDEINKILKDSDIIGVGYWSLMPAFDEIVEEFCKIIPSDGKKRRFFFDFADFSRRDRNSLVKTLQRLKELNEIIPMILSVNEHEAAVLFEIAGEIFDDKANNIAEKTKTVRQFLGLDELVIHTPNFAIAASKIEGAALIPQAYVEKPVRTAGAGDTFNGAYIAACLAKLDISERLFTANAAVTYFLNTGTPPNRQNLENQLNRMR